MEPGDGAATMGGQEGSMNATTTRRTRIREVLPERLPVVHQLTRSAEYRLPARDPESALVYLHQAHQELTEILAELDPRGLERRIARRTA